MEFIKILQDNMKESKMSVYRLSKLSGIPESTIRNYENGTIPSLDIADKLLKALGASMTIGVVQKEATP